MTGCLPALGCPGKNDKAAGRGEHVPLLVGRVGLLEVLLIAGLALAPVVIAIVITLWARLRGEQRD